MVEVTKTARSLIGVVTSDKMNKSIIVTVVNHVKHPLYGKYLRREKKMVAHDEQNSCKVGDTVQIRETRPISKTKSWVLDKIIERAA
ncbi:MAG: 30S ribosomal protein S17 [Gammaproteobacteria bacterium]|nr:30S ribosomal protein S17 [Gammaproteobacteria bacterium]